MYFMAFIHESPEEIPISSGDLYEQMDGLCCLQLDLARSSRRDFALGFGRGVDVVRF